MIIQEGKRVHKTLQKCIKLSGGQQRLAHILSVTRTQIDRWLNNVRPIPYKHAITLAQLFEFSLIELNPAIGENKKIAKKRLHECQNGAMIKSYNIKEEVENGF